MESTWPGSTYASKNFSRASNFRAIKRSKYIAKKRAAAMPAIQRRTYGKSVITKLSSTTSIDTSAIADYTTVYGLVSLAQQAADWTNYRDSYALFNILSFSVQIMPQNWAYSAGQDRVCALCYDTKDNVAMASLNSTIGHQQHILMNFAGANTSVYYFKGKAKATGSVPQSTASSTESWGYLKGFADNADFGNYGGSIAKIKFTITVCFSSEQ